MLDYEGEEPKKLGYDRPSEKLINFLSKHYNLVDYVPQNNNFVVFNNYFIEKKTKQELDTHSYVKDSIEPNQSYKNNDIINNEESSNIYYKKKIVSVNDKFNKKKGNIEDEISHISNQLDNMKIYTVNKNKDFINSDSDNYKVEENLTSKKGKTRKLSQDFNDQPNTNNKSNHISINNSPPWAVNNFANNFISSSSSYGAFCRVKK